MLSRIRIYFIKYFVVLKQQNIFQNKIKAFLKKMSCEQKDGNYWWIIVVTGLIIVGLVILIMFLTRSTPTPKFSEVCKSAEYPTIAENISCDPNTVEVSLTASDNEVQILSGDSTKMYNYNKSFPGPLIEGKKGDTLIVHFLNDISEPSTIVWHGLLTPGKMDGSSISQFPVEPGETFTYEFTLSRAGLFYYHSDINPREQVSKGLYGAILVHDYYEDECYSLPSAEKVLAFSDLKLDSSNQVDIDFSCDPCERASQQVNGIVGNVLLTNGVSDGCITLTRNEPTRLRMVNCAVDRFMKISIEGHDMLRIGGDQGLLEKPILIKEGTGLMLTTGERADIVFVPRSESIKLLTEENPRGVQKVESDECGNCELTDCVTINENKLTLVTFKTVESDNVNSLEVALELDRIKKIRVDHCTPVIPVSLGNYEPDCEGNIDFFAFKVDGEGVPFDCLTSKQAPIAFEDGTYIIEVTNKSPLANNFHLHGFTFQHLDTLLLSRDCKDRIVNKVLENKDTIYIPPRPDGYRSKTVVRLAVKFDSRHPDKRNIIAYGKDPTEKRSGGWIFQSHILTHAQLGQEGFIQIVAECDRRRYSSSSGYLNSYSSYTSGDHSTCLTRSSDSSRSKTDHYSRSSDSSSSLSTSSDYSSKTDSVSIVHEITKSLITCSCGSGLSTSICSCSKSFRSSLESRLSKSRDSYYDDDSIEYSNYKPFSSEKYSYEDCDTDSY